MQKPNFIPILIILILLTFSQNSYGQTSSFKNIKWKKERIATGLIWKSSHTFLEDSIPQNINVLFLRLHKRAISILYNPRENLIVSKQAKNADALAAVNAGFFNIRDGGSVTYIKTRGIIADNDTAVKWSRNANMTGSLIVDMKGHLIIDISHPNNWYDMHTDYPEVLLTGPLLLLERVKSELPATALVINRHPRTAIGKRGKNWIMLVTIDGRTEQAAGMTIVELTDFMISLGCRDAINLDGGGSTTMWISGKPYNGVVNMPCDNKKFDHEGERAVSDILIIK